MKKKIIILLHLFIWLFAGFVNINNFTKLKSAEMLISYFISMLFLMISFYLFYLLIIPKLFEKKKILSFLVVSFIAIFALPFFGYSSLLFNKALFKGSFDNFYHGYTFSMNLQGAYAIFIAATFGTLFKLIISWFDMSGQKEIAEKHRLISELALLKNKVNPHFLFNTLNNIDILIYQDPEKASKTLIKLSEIMRYMSYETVLEYASLSSELKYIENMIELYKLRINNPDCIKLFLPLSYPNLKIAPLLFIPFIENAFKYAVFKDEHAGFSLQFDVQNSVVNFTISNYYNLEINHQKNKQGGTGIENVKKRLAIIYPNKHWLHIKNSESRFIVELKIDTLDN